MNDQFNVEAKTIANKIPETKVGLGIELLIPIITQVLPLLIKSYGSSAESSQQYLASHYDDETDSFGDNLERRVMIQAKRAARQQGKQITRSDATVIGKEVLKHALNAPKSSLTACFRLSDTMIIPETDGV